MGSEKTENNNSFAETHDDDGDYEKTKRMPNKTSNLGATTPIPPSFNSTQPEDSPVAQCLLPDPLVDLVVERVVRILYRRNPELKRKPGKLRKRTIIEKIYQVDPRAYSQGVELTVKLFEQFARAEALIKELRSEREQILRIVKPEMFR
jgi:hypothetical protein